MAKFLAVAFAMALAACGGRAHLSEDSGQSFRRVFQAQAEARPSKNIAPLSADSAKIIIDNHYAVFRDDKGGRPNAGAAMPMAGMMMSGGSGLSTPAAGSVSTEMPSYENPSPIRLQAK
jgi:hypothetical protein